MTDELCPCQQDNSSLTYTQCCKPLHSGHAIAQSPEQLMRSRYSAFVKGEFAYLVATHHPAFRNGMTAANLAQGSYPKWLGLVIESTKLKDEKGQVTFKAWYRDDAGIDAIFEQSQFCLLDGRWYYTQGDQFEVKLPKRNDKCICHSGKKFKQCCMIHV